MPKQTPLRQARTAKSVTGRYELHYFNRLSRFRLWWWGLCLAAIAFSGVWVGSLTLVKKTTAYSPGPLSSYHSFFATRCNVCHASIQTGGRQVATFLQPASDNACLLCHEAPAHQVNQIADKVPACSDCHLEHQGLVSLVHTADSGCVRCHNNLETASQPKSIYPRSFAKTVVGFNTNREHPQFYSKGTEFNSPPAIIFHHGIHVGQPIRTAKGEFKTLDCDDCHRPVAARGQAQWKYAQDGMADEKPFSLDVAERLHTDWGRDLMTMPNFEQHCAGCHLLRFDERITESAPHPKQPAEVDVFVRQKLKDYIDHHPAERVASLQIPEGGSGSGRLAPNSLQQSVDCAEKLLWGNSPCSSRAALGTINGMTPAAGSVCGYCHQLNVSGDSGSLPMAPATALKNPPFMPHAMFNHRSHFGVTCRSCHQFKQIALSGNQTPPTKGATGVLQTSEVNMRDFENVFPTIEACRACHSGNPPSTDKADNSCVLCHQYHKWDPLKEKTHVPYTLQQLRGSESLDLPAAIH